MASDRLVRFAAILSADPSLSHGEAARRAGYSESTARSRATDLVSSARRAGLLIDPKPIQDAVAVIEAELPEIARVLVKLAKDGDLDAIKEAFDRARGKAKQSVDITTDGQPIIPTVFRPAADTETPEAEP